MKDEPGARMRQGPLVWGGPPSPGPAVLPRIWHGLGAGVSGKACPRVHSPALRSWGSGGPCRGSRRGCAQSQHGAPPEPPGWGTRLAGAAGRRGFSSSFPFSMAAAGHQPLPYLGSCPTSERRQFELREVTVMLTAEPDTISSVSLLPAWTGLRHFTWRLRLTFKKHHLSPTPTPPIPVPGNF